MASIVLSSAVSAFGSSYLSGLGTMAAHAAFSHLGNLIDQKLFNTNVHSHTHGARLKNFQLQSAAYGNMIPIVFGTMRLSGNIIWALPIREIPNSQTVVHGGKGGRISQTHTEYLYTASFAVSICEGEIESVSRVWANDSLLNLSRYNIRFYKGSESQVPDTLIEGVLGLGKTPAYRGQAYAVFQDFPLSEFSNVIPNLVFEVKFKDPLNNIEKAESLINSVVMLPGGGEFVYDTCTQYKVDGNFSGDKWCQKGKLQTINQHNVQSKPNALLALDQLKQTLPAVSWVAPVVTWFGTSLNASLCKILPGVEFKSSTRTIPDEWQVAGYRRDTAYLVSQTSGRPNYGGTINDKSLLRYVDELKSRSYSIMFYPMPFMDLERKPWRGRITGKSSDVAAFFRGEEGYNNFILHYAKLLKGKIDAFVIGSELIGLTKIRDENNTFPAVKELVNLARLVKETLGKDVIVTYAADWSEYHHTEGGWYNLDELWASEYIDVIGIDAYFPLSNATKSVYEVEKLMTGWSSGEGYDHYFQDTLKNVLLPLAPQWAWKDINWWWSNEHINPNGEKTAWKPKSKKIWFTEYGFPSVDCCSNQPNVFYDSSSKESLFPIHSKGKIDFKAQRAAIEATERKWKGSEMIERMFLWAWDARPYPYWPDLAQVWADGKSWSYGHWVQGKLGGSSLASVIEGLSRRGGINASEIEFRGINSAIDGMLIESQSTIRSNIELLRNAFFFDVLEEEGKLHFISKDSKKVVLINEEELLPFSKDGEKVHITRLQEIELPKKVDVNFINNNSYRIGNQHAVRYVTSSEHKITYDLPISMTEQGAKQIADLTLFKAWLERTQYMFALPVKYITLQPGDLVRIRLSNVEHIIRIKSIVIGNNLMLKVEGVAEHVSMYSLDDSVKNPRDDVKLDNLQATKIELLDVPTLVNNYSLHQPHILIAAAGMGSSWKGTTIYISGDEGANYKPCLTIQKESVVGAVLENINNLQTATINLIAGKLYSSLERNLAVIGNEVVEFNEIKLLDNQKYQINITKRGLFSTESELTNHSEGERFILIDDSIAKLDVPIGLVGKKIAFKAVTYGATLGETEVIWHEFQANNLKPFAPVNIKANFNEAGNLELKWQRRSRVYTNSDNLIPLGEESEKYLIELYENDTLKTSLESFIPSCFIEKQHINKEAEKQVKIYQLSTIIGKGYAGNVKL